MIDRSVCTFFKTGKCKLCERFCEPGAVVFDQQDSFLEVKVGAVIVATGFQLYKGEALAWYGHGKYPNVLSALEFERLNNAAGPTEGVVKTKEGQVPKAVAILHCIGSRDKHYQEYCSRVCCMYSL